VKRLLTEERQVELFRAAKVSAVRGFTPIRTLVTGPYLREIQLRYQRLLFNVASAAHIPTQRCVANYMNERYIKLFFRSFLWLDN